MTGQPIISALTAVPLLGGLLLLFMPPQAERFARILGVILSGVILALTILVAANFDPATSGMQFEEAYQWITTLGVEYKLGVDGLSMLLLLLTALLTPLAMLASDEVKDRTRLYFALVLFLEAGLFGTFTALNFFHWFLFYELSLVPAFFLVRLWGGPLRAQASTQFFLYTMVGSVALLLAFLALYLCTGTFDFEKLAELGRNGDLTQALSEKLGWRDLTTRNLTIVIFALAFLGFAVKVPLFPFHTWLPATYSEAPTGTAMLLTGLLSKMGVYGFLRLLLPLFPVQMHWLATPLLVLAVLSIVMSAAAAWAQKDLKRILAYSSINHLGYCMLGVFALATAPPAHVAQVEKLAAMNGVLLQMFNHGLTAATLFWMVGVLQRKRAGLRGIDDFGGIRKAAPILCGLMGIAFFSSLGLPGLNGFVGEFLIFKGAFALTKWAAAISVAGLLLTAIFILGLLQKVFMGPQRVETFPDLNPKEIVLFSIPVALMFVLGLYPQALVRFYNTTCMDLVAQIGF